MQQYFYNDNGRIIIPDKNIISGLPSDGGKMWNRLIFESSPYLLQHAANPVDWYPWSEEAFKLAKELDKPIFLSIGYTTCHWCHVMEHESFEDTSVADLMNESFINIKVDREERPDIDNIYMSVTQMLTGRGGWPMTVIMTPDKIPFFAGTYFPKDTRYSRIGMTDLVPKISAMWYDFSAKDSLLQHAEELKKRLININRPQQKKGGDLSDNIFVNIYNRFNETYDSRYGGFGSSPKFPKPHDYMFLSNYYYRSNEDNAIKMIEESLTNMRNGGIFDQIGFGFHRYSTDSKWLVPHFEKMLYDQALLVHAYIDAYISTKDEMYAQVADEIIEYVLRDMTSPEGGFYSAEDADSEGEEGTFYLWRSKEVIKILGEEDGSFMNDVLNIKEEGNWKDGYTHATNIPHINKTWGQISAKHGLSIEDCKVKFSVNREKLFNHRENRVHPQKDDKILTDWNGLMISAIARASYVFNNDLYRETAIKAMEFITNNLVDSEGRLQKRIRIGSGAAGLTATIEDYSFTIWGLIELYQATYNPKYLEIASNYSEYTIKHFLDSKDGSFFFTPDYGEELIVRSKDVYDGAIPSGNSVSAYNFIRLSRILSRTDYEDIATKLLHRYSNRLNKSGFNYTMMMKAVDFLKGPSYEVIIVGDRKSSKMENILQEINQSKQYNKVTVLVEAKNRKKLEKLLPYITYYQTDDSDSPVVYVCQNYTCKLPTSDINKIKELLK